MLRQPGTGVCFQKKHGAFFERPVRFLLTGSMQAGMNFFSGCFDDCCILQIRFSGLMREMLSLIFTAFRQLLGDTPR